MTSARVGVSVVLWRSRTAVVETTLQSVLGGSLVPEQVLLLSNEDPDGAIRSTFASALPQSVRFRHTPSNLGYAEGHNQNLADLFSNPEIDFVLILNPDVALDKTAISSMVYLTTKIQGPAIIGPVLELAEGDNLVGEGRIDTAGIRWSGLGRHFDDLQGQKLEVAPTRPRRVAGISGACLLVSRRAYEIIVSQTGEFFDADFLAYREDAELGLRADALGVTMWIDGHARARHGRQLRGNKRGTSRHADWLGVRNRFLIAFKYGSRRPGGHFGAPIRDIVVVCCVLLRDRFCVSALSDAWRARHRMLVKRRLLRLVQDAQK